MTPRTDPFPHAARCIVRDFACWWSFARSIREAHTLGVMVHVYTSMIPPDATLYEWVGRPGV